MRLAEILLALNCVGVALATEGGPSFPKVKARWAGMKATTYPLSINAAWRSPFLRQLRGGNGSHDLDSATKGAALQCEGATDAIGVTKSSAKNLRKIAEREAKKHADPEGLAKLEQGAAAFTEGDFVQASTLFTQAAKICSSSKAPPAASNRASSSSVAAKKSSEEIAETSQAPGMRLILAPPETNLQVSF